MLTDVAEMLGSVIPNEDLEFWKLEPLTSIYLYPESDNLMCAFNLITKNKSLKNKNKVVFLLLTQK